MEAFVMSMFTDARLLVTGSRCWIDIDTIWHALRMFRSQCSNQPTLICGHCPTGADAIAEHAAKELGYTLELYPAEWQRYRKRAGFIRNEVMVQSKPTHCFAFIVEHSRGASHCLALANKAGIPTKDFRC